MCAHWRGRSIAVTQAATRVTFDLGHMPRILSTGSECDLRQDELPPLCSREDCHSFRVPVHTYGFRGETSISMKIPNF
jgi:hypothetical protein